MLETCQTCGQVLNKLHYVVKMLQVVLKMWQYGMLLHAGFFIFSENQLCIRSTQGMSCEANSTLGLLSQDFFHFTA